MDDFEAKLKSRAEARVGTVLRGKWRIQRVLGVGGMATVFEATHRNGKRGAVKMLHLELCVDQSVRSRFLREGYVANRVDHPGSVSVLDDDFEEDGSVFLVMELLEGRSLDAVARPRPGKRLEAGEVLVVADAVLDVLAAAHEKGIVHRDLKPENLFLTTRGEIKVLDFGIARLHDASGGVTGRTKDGSQMGTPAFMPPEQALGNWDAVTASSDLWAVGATLFTLLTGRVVHAGDTTNQVLLAAMTKHAPKVASVLPATPAEMAALIDRALEKEPADRWEDARAMQREVRRVQDLYGLTAVQFLPDAPASEDAPPLGEPTKVETSGRGAAPGADDRAAGETSLARGETPVGVEESLTKPEAMHPAEPAEPQGGASAQAPDTPLRTVPGLTTDPPVQPVASRRRLVIGVAIAASIVIAAALTISFTTRRDERSVDSAAPAAPEPTHAAPTATASGPSVEPGEPAPPGSNEPSSSAAPVVTGVSRPSGSARPGATAKPGPTGDPFGRWK